MVKRPYALTRASKIKHTPRKEWTLGDLLIFSRLTELMPVEDAADAADVASVTYNKWERAGDPTGSYPDVYSLAVLCKLFKINPYEAMAAALITRTGARD